MTRLVRWSNRNLRSGARRSARAGLSGRGLKTRSALRIRLANGWPPNPAGRRTGYMKGLISGGGNMAFLFGGIKSVQRL